MTDAQDASDGHGSVVDPIGGRVDYGAVVLSHILPHRLAELEYAAERLTLDHFTDAIQRTLWQVLLDYWARYREVFPASYLTDLLQRHGVEAGKVLVLSNAYDNYAADEVTEGQFRAAIDHLRDTLDRFQTGKALTLAYDILERGLERGGETLSGHRAAREFFLAEIAEIEDRDASEEAPEGDIRNESERLIRLYQEAQNNPDRCGIEFAIPHLDRETGGVQLGELALIAAYTSQGKASPLWTPVLTPAGWRPIGDLQVGDRIMSVSGQPQVVTGVFDRGVMPTFRVQTRDGAEVVTAADHLWQVQDQNDRAGKTRTGSRVLSTDQLRAGLARRRRFYLPLPAPMEFDPVELPVDPYTLGVLLGDGSFRMQDVRVCLNKQDAVEIAESLVAPGEWVECSPRTGAVEYRLRDPQQALRETLKTLDLWGRYSLEKHVPAPYLGGRSTDRLALLQGIMDTDGWVSQGTAHLALSSEQLLRQVVEIVQSLGGSTGPVQRHTTTHADSWRISLHLPAEMDPFRVTRKLVAWRPGRGPRRVITSVEPVGAEEVRCISVSSDDHLYVTQDYLVTHNSQCCAQMAWHTAVVQQRGVYFAATETVRDTTIRRILSRHSRQAKFGLPDGLNARDILRGTLTEREQRSYFDVIEDFSKTAAMLHIAQMPRNATLEYVAAGASRVNRISPIELLVVDSLQLLVVPGSSRGEREDFNMILRQAKVLATTFANGRGVALVSPWQIKQAAYTAALDAQHYTLTSLSDTSEAEKSSDFIIWLLLTQAADGDNRLAKAGTLKLRDGALVPAFDIEVDYRTSFLGDHGAVAPVARRTTSSTRDQFETLTQEWGF